MKHLLLSAVAAASLILPAYGAEPAPIPSPGEIAAAAPASDWVAIAPSDLLVMDLAPDAKGNPRRVVIQLMPAPFSQGWIGNIRKLAAAHWWDGTSVNRVQDNYVAQWGDATEKKALPKGLAVVSERQYVSSGRGYSYISGRLAKESDKVTTAEDAAEQAIRAASMPKSDGKFTDNYAQFAGAVNGWVLAADTTGVWPVHCYGAVGVGRNMSPDTGSGAELYTVIGHAPRHLDRNIAVVGRVVSGIEHLSSLPRGTGALGFYEDAAERVAITSIRVATELPAADQPRFEYLSTESDSFARYADARQNRRDPFFITPAGGADICNIPVPVRPVAAK
ncbi:peptidylprolyl isomerase [Sphingopyxis sp. H038]|uniref:peptidylprolyl isomerase n=1 Tax=unclassified Sphingopyxis TaxID=2614943 RepID=UPI00073152D2|nr:MULTISPECIES: peptidylprolyl isomerase [unclassified Sphingopyxis]KTE01964.1 peptidylprolyl isomerase [Sphingopyxis sp. H012]KTE09713.1 peptidylprolyl isomerase [Sphingopyxis sp. H053]KTE15106.1 peptidylprolyl isomerase [Sphingopyxis sp. H093]KTE29815.1 peptidylprolyl isomerase [Sphingopyxis sp. H080]KTE32956.1 peptidylprolyl isomerase [Sphingopyxis sp. H038]